MSKCNVTKSPFIYKKQKFSVKIQKMRKPTDDVSCDLLRRLAKIPQTQITSHFCTDTRIKVSNWTIWP